MKTSENQLSVSSLESRSRMLFVLAAVALALCAVVYLIARDQAVIMLGLGVAAIIGYCLFRWREGATLLFVFILYANLAVVAVEFHGVPKVAAAAVSLILALPLANYVFIQRQRLIFDRTCLLMLIYLAALVVSSLLVKDIKLALIELANFLIEGLILYFLMINVVRTLSMMKRVIWVLLMACTLMGGLSLFQEVTHTYDNSYGGLAQRRDDLDMGKVNFDEFSGSRRAGGPTGTENRYAQILIVILPLAAWQAYNSPSRKAKLFAATAGALTLSGIMLTFSRGTFVTLTLMVIIAMFLRYVRPSKVFGLGFALVLVVSIAMPEYITRVSTVGGLSELFGKREQGSRELDGALRGRFAENIGALNVFLDHPLVGVGPGQFGKFYSRTYGNEVGTKRLVSNRRAHSLYFEMAAETGVLGLAAFMTVALATMFRLWQARRQWLHIRPDLAHLATAFLLSMIAYLGTAMFLHLAYQRYYWFLLALAGAAIRIFRNEPMQEAPEPMAEERSNAARYTALA